MTKPWLEVQLTSEVEGLTGLEITYVPHGWNFLNELRISAGLEPSSLTEGGYADEIDNTFQTFLVKYKGPAVTREIVYVSFPRAVTARYLLLQADYLIKSSLALMEVKLLVTSLVCSQDQDDGAQAGISSMESEGSVFMSTITYSCGPGQKFQGTEQSRELS